MAVKLKNGEPIFLTKHSETPLDTISIRLNWGVVDTDEGYSSDNTKKMDLDIGCMYQLKNGEKGSLQALGGRFGSFMNSPYIQIDGDDTTGDVATGENIRINGSFISEIEKVLVYAYIYEGAINWQQTNAYISIECPGIEDIFVEMDDYNTTYKLCGVLLLENIDNTNFIVKRIFKFYENHKALDKEYNWGIPWKDTQK
ncbi:MAG: Tellurium resistance [Acutalibacteraceae bacterium]